MIYIHKKAVHGERPGLTRIFYHTLCTGNAASYTAEHISRIFEEGIDTDALQARLIAMMRYLQDGYHSDEYPGPAGRYSRSKEEYPEKYEALVSGLSVAALHAISTHSYEGQEFLRILSEDRRKNIELVAKASGAVVPDYLVA